MQLLARSACAIATMSLAAACARSAAPATSPPSAAMPVATSTATTVGTPAPAAIEVTIGTPDPVVAPPDATTAVATPADEDQDDVDAKEGDEVVPRGWSGPDIPKMSLTEAMAVARATRSAWLALDPPPPTPAGGTANASNDAALRTWFLRENALLDRASRAYAEAFNAADATPLQRVEAISEAADLDAVAARRLDDAGIGSMPAAWRTDSAIGVSFEDVSIGPTRRVRDESRALARQCVETAHKERIAGHVVDRCRQIRAGTPRPTARVDGGATGGCACDPGDPLCSASLGGWCGAKK